MKIGKIIKSPLIIVLITTLFFVYLFLSFSTNAHGAINNYSSVVLEINPKQPRANETVVAEVKSFSANLSYETIVWNLNGVEVLRGVGETRFRFNNGPVGSETIIKVSVLTETGGSVSDSKALNPSEIDFIYESDTQTPMWYKGKALPTAGTKVKVVAFPRLYYKGSELDPESLTYTWYLGSAAQYNQSGRGRNAFSVLMGNMFGPPQSVSVRITSKSGLVSWNEELIIKLYEPEIIFYDHSLIYGLFFEKALSRVTSKRGESINLFAQPFFFGPNKNSKLTYEWKVNKETVVEEESNPWLLFLNIGSEVRGEHSISVKIMARENIFQESSKKINLYVN